MATAPAPGSRLGTLLVAVLVVVLAAQLAHWTWVFFAPTPRAASPAGETGADLAIASRLFGGAGTASSTAGASPSGLRLKGVVAPTPGVAASAIFNSSSGRDVSVYIDREVQPGVKLVEVNPDSVVVSRSGVRERIELEKRVALRPSAPGGRAAPGFRLNVARSGSNNYTISRKELDTALKDPGQLSYLGRLGIAPQGGVRMEDAPAGSLAQKLGLQPGDVIRRVNGQAVASAGDLARLYQQFATLSMIQAEVQRDGATVQISYAIQP